MIAKNIGQSQLIFLTTTNADLLYMKPHARVPSFPRSVNSFCHQDNRDSEGNISPFSWERCMSPLAEATAPVFADLSFSDNTPVSGTGKEG